MNKMYDGKFFIGISNLNVLDIFSPYIIIDIYKCGLHSLLYDFVSYLFIFVISVEFILFLSMLCIGYTIVTFYHQYKNSRRSCNFFIFLLDKLNYIKNLAWVNESCQTRAKTKQNVAKKTLQKSLKSFRQMVVFCFLN